MSLPMYEQYKDSNANWLGVIPSHWEAQPCRYFVVEQTAKNENAENQAYLSLMANVGVIPYEEKGDIGNKKPEDLSKCKLVAKGDLVINSMNYGIGSYGLSGLSGVCSPVYIVLRPLHERVRPRFAFRVFENRAFQTYAQSFGSGILAHRAAINWDILKGMHVGIPPLEEQDAILDFLDRETVKIAALIAEQEKLIALLAEKREATISYAVTKGLNPNAPTKDSGVMWLGEVPAHWKVVPLKWLLDNVKAGPFGSALTKDMYVSNGYRVYGQEQVIPADFSRGDYYIGDEAYKELEQYAVKPGDILISCVGTFGKIAIVPQGIEPGIINPRLIRLRAGALLNSEFLTVVLRSAIVFEQFAMVSRGGTMDTINIGTLNAITLALPPLNEQNEILAFLAKEIAKLDALSLAAEQAITLLKERRSALIAAAVTGKIDVRNAISQDAAEKLEAIAA